MKLGLKSPKADEKSQTGTKCRVNHKRSSNAKIGLLVTILLASLMCTSAVNAQITKKDCSGTEKEIIDCYVKDRPELKRIMACESGLRHTDKGLVIRGVANRLDIGVAQINLYWHAESAKRLGLDLFELEDNLTYALWLYDNEGNVPWRWSRKCWDK